MNMRVRQLWAPALSTFLVSVSVQFVALRVPQLPPWVFFTRNGVSIVLAPLWMLALPFIGALGAWLSVRAGGNTRDRLLSALGSAWLMGSILTLGVPLSMVVERHFSLRIKLTAYIVYMIAWCLVPAVLLALGALPWLGRPRILGRRNLQAAVLSSHVPGGGAQPAALPPLHARRGATSGARAAISGCLLRVGIDGHGRRRDAHLDPA